MRQKRKAHGLVDCTQNQLFHSQAEMAAKIGVSESELLTLLKRGIGLAYNTNTSDSDNGEYEFREDTFDRNVVCYRCWSDGGHQYERDSYYDYLPRGGYMCKRCGEKLLDPNNVPNTPTT